MILYVNGDSNAAAAEAVNPHGFAEDDNRYIHLGRAPHPENLEISFGKVLADRMGAQLECHAESASSNSRILRTTYQYLTKLIMSGDKRHFPDYVLIGWSTWERQEWLVDGVWWQVNAGGIGHDWPQEVKDRYRDYILKLDYEQACRRAHREIYEFHVDLKSWGVPHLFFNCFEPMTSEPVPLDWGHNYLEPYNPDFTYYNWLTARGFQPVYPGSYHFGADAHAAWAEFLYPYMVNLSLTKR